MILRWLRSEGAAPGVGGTSSSAPDEQSCPGLARALEQVLSAERRPEVLDLGQPTPAAALYLANLGARVAVERFEPPAPPPEAEQPDGESAPPLVISQPDEKFDLVLTWELGDFVSPDRLSEFGAELVRVLAPGGWLVLFARDAGAGTDVDTDTPGCYRPIADDRVVRSAGNGAQRRRWCHPIRFVERALAPLSVQSIHLQRNRVREFLLRKPRS